MDLDSPEVVAGPVSGRQRFLAEILTRKRLFLQIAILLLITGAALYLWFGVHEKKQPENTAQQSGDQHTAAATADIGLYKGTKDPEELRVLVNSYVDNEDYISAYNTANTLVSTTNDPDDYMTLLWLCTLYNVPNPSDCIDKTSEVLQSKLSSLSFVNAYMAGSLLEQSHRNNQALVFYNRAYQIYNPKLADGNIMSKDKLKKHIDALR